jgi:hypothetical protein
VARLQLIAWLLISIWVPAGLADESFPTEEYRVKAAILYNFSKFIHWRDAAFADQASPILLCILTPDPFGSFINELVAGRRVGPDQRPLSVVRIEVGNQAPRCHMLFIPRGKRLPVQRSLDTLLVSEDADITETHAHINLFTVEGQVRFEIDLDSLADTRISISSKLLNLAKITWPRSGL